jgi:hypothetical protein
MGGPGRSDPQRPPLLLSSATDSIDAPASRPPNTRLQAGVAIAAFRSGEVTWCYSGFGLYDHSIKARSLSLPLDSRQIESHNPHDLAFVALIAFETL